MFKRSDGQQNTSLHKLLQILGLGLTLGQRDGCLSECVGIRLPFIEDRNDGRARTPTGMCTVDELVSTIILQQDHSEVSSRVTQGIALGLSDNDRPRLVSWFPLVLEVCSPTLCRVSLASWASKEPVLLVQPSETSDPKAYWASRNSAS